MGNRDFYERFPSARPKQQVERRTSPELRDRGITNLVSVLSFALPLLREHANAEPYARPIRVQGGVFRRGLTGAWVFYDHHIERRPDAYHPSATFRYLLTEEGDVGLSNKNVIGTSILQVDDGVSGLSRRSIAQLFPEGVPPVQEAVNKLSGILAAAGVEFSFPTIEK